MELKEGESIEYMLKEWTGNIPVHLLSFLKIFDII